MRTSKSSVIIIGSGISGLYAALKISEFNPSCNVTLLTKSTLNEGNSRYAQGGIVAVLPENKTDSVELHVNDTINAGAGLSCPDVAAFISQNSAEVIKDLINYGVNFDKSTDNNLAFTLEAAHSVRRIMHSGGDATGKNIEQTLSALVRTRTNIKIFEKTLAVELLINSDKECCGVITYSAEKNKYETILSPFTIIATGGAGQVYSNTTNPSVATGDGIALAYRANAVIQNMEFVQFHPTALTVVKDGTRFLISESVRGEGGLLKNLDNEYFSMKYHERGDLAPRDILTRAIFYEMLSHNHSHVLLDTSKIGKEKMETRFPNIINVCKECGIDILKGDIPVSPAAHYMMGGIKISVDGKTTIPGLFAVGEAGCSSLHGANRLASNSLLECVVISKELADYFKKNSYQPTLKVDEKIAQSISEYDNDILCQEIPEVNYILSKLKDNMWQNAGIVRNEEKLKTAFETINQIKADFDRKTRCNSLKEYELRNMLVVSELIVKSALLRKESRGAHYREDYPERRAKAEHSFVQKDELSALASLE